MATFENSTDETLWTELQTAKAKLEHYRESESQTGDSLYWESHWERRVIDIEEEIERREAAQRAD